MSSCPTKTELTALLTGELPETERKPLEHHLEECVVCRQRLDLMAVGDGNWLGDARAYVKAGSPIQVRQVMDRLKSRSGSAVGIKVLPPDPLLTSAGTLGRLGDYEILGELGRGGMGVVFKARQQSLQREVALKVILAGQLASEAQVRRFQIEAEAAAKLDHPHIVPIYEIGEHEGRHYFSMKLIEGASLKDRRAEFQALPPSAGGSSVEVTRRERKLARLMADVAHGVHHAHQRGVLHRDLKPGNVLIDKQGKPHLTDFGLAKLLEGDSDLTLSRTIMGTPEYMSPEQASGQTRMITTASDIYSLGAVLYELLAGRPPFAGDDAMLTLNKVINEEPKSPRTLKPSVSRDLETICLKCLEREPAKRYRSAEALAEELERVERGEPIRSRPVSAPARVWRWCKRKPALATLVIALHVVFAAGLAGIVWQWQRADRHAAEESAQRQRAEAFGRSEAAQRRTAEELARREALQHERAEFQRAELLLARGELTLPLALLARSLRENPTNAVLAARIRSVLDLRGVSLPAMPPLTQPSPIRLARYSPDGKSILTVSADPAARLWPADTGQSPKLLWHGGAITSFAFSPTAPLLVTATELGRMRLWNSTNGSSINTPLVHGNAPPLLAFNRDGSKMISASENMLRLWEMPAAKQIASVRPASGGTLRAVSFSPDGRFLVTAGRAATVVWEAELLKRLGELPGAPAAQFTPENDHLLLNRAVFWNWHEARRLTTQFETGEEPMLAAQFSPDGRSLLLAAGDWGGRLLDLETLTPRVPILTHPQPVRDVAFSRDGGRMLTVSAGGFVYVWDARTGLPLTEPLLHHVEVRSAEFSPDGHRLLVLPADGQAHIWDLRLNGARSLRFLHSGVVTSVQFVQEGKRLLTTSRDGTAQLWERDTGRLVFPPLRHEDAVNAATVSPDGRWIATVGADRMARVWDAQTGGQKLWLLHDGIPHKVEFDASGARLLTGAEDGAARIWDTATGALLLHVEHKEVLCAAQFSGDGKQILTASRDGTAQVWDAQTGQPVFKPFAHRNAVVAAAFVPDGQHIVTASRDRTLQIWDGQNGRASQRPINHHAGLRMGVLHFNPAGNQVVTAAGNRAFAWNLNDGHPVCPPLAHADLVLAARFSPDGRMVATASRDDTARFWDVATGLPLSEPLPHGARVECLAFSPDGRWLTTASADGGVHLWEVPRLSEPVPQWLPDLAEALGQQKVNQGDRADPVSPEELRTVQTTLAKSGATDDYTAWAKWLFNQSIMRPLSPNTQFTPEDYVALLLSGTRIEHLQEAILRAPANPHAHARLARALIADGSPDVIPSLRNADWHSRYAEMIAPGDPEVREIRQAVRAVTNSPAATAPSQLGSKATTVRATTSSRFSFESK